MDATFTTPPVPPRARPLPRLAGDAMRRPGGRLALSVLSVVLAIVGVGMFASPFATDIYAARRQSVLRSRFDDPKYRDAYRTRTIRVGQGLTRLSIPSIKLDVLV